MTIAFQDALAACVRRIPTGKVATCGAIARALGDVRAARAVAERIREHPELDPSGRVVRADGRPVLPLRAGKRSAQTGLGSAAQADSNLFVDRLEAVPLLAQLRAEQVRLARLVKESGGPRRVRTLGGVDVAYVGGRAFAAAVVLDAESLELIDVSERAIDVDFPYIPSYLAFREFPAVQEVVSQLRRAPDVLFVDGHGRLHPALFGFACFTGVSLGIPTIGIAKHPLVGTPLPSQRTESGAIPIFLQGRVRGYAWRPERASRPFYVSVGHRTSLNRALQLAQQSTRDHYPEPLRIADRISKEGKRKKKGERLASEPTATRRPHSQNDQGI